jgi:hypothetical protein
MTSSASASWRAENFVLVFASDDIDTLLCVGLYTGKRGACIGLDEVIE